MTEINTSQSPNTVPQSLDLLPLNIIIPKLEAPALTEAFFNAYKTPIDSSCAQVSDGKKLSSVFRGRTLIECPPLTCAACVVAEISEAKGESNNSQIQLIQHYDSLVEWTFPEDSGSAGILYKSAEWFEIADAMHLNSQRITDDGGVPPPM